MPKFPVDAPKRRVVQALEELGFQKVNEREHISMLRQNSDGTRTPLTLPNHRTSKVRPCEPSALNPALRAKISSALTAEHELPGGLLSGGGIAQGRQWSFHAVFGNRDAPGLRTNRP